MNHAPYVKVVVQYWMPVILYAGMIVYLSSLSTPTENLPHWFDDLNDKMIHGIEYGVLGVLYYRAFTFGAGERLRGLAPFLAIGCAILFGLSDEIHQFFVPLRYADGWDWLADGIGASLGVVICGRSLYGKIVLTPHPINNSRNLPVTSLPCNRYWS